MTRATRKPMVCRFGGSRRDVVGRRSEQAGCVDPGSTGDPPRSSVGESFGPFPDIAALVEGVVGTIGLVVGGEVGEIVRRIDEGRGAGHRVAVVEAVDEIVVGEKLAEFVALGTLPGGWSLAGQCWRTWDSRSSCAVTPSFLW